METITSTELLTYISFGYSFIVSLIAFGGSDYLWKNSFFNKCLIAAVLSAFVGLIFEFINLLRKENGLTVVVMFIPLIYLGYFQLFRWIFKRWKGTEPYITSASSTIGGTPIDIFDTDGNKRKYQKDRKIMASDFLFSFLQGLVPIGTIWFLLFLCL